MPLQIVNPPTHPSELFTKRLQQLKDFASNGHNIPILSTPGWNLLAEALFSRASLDFLKRTPTPILGAIIHNSAMALERFQKDRSPCLVECHQYDESEERVTSTGIHIVVSDRPFIVDSITECLRSLGLEPTAMLHPVVSLAGSPLSLTYVEVDKIEDPGRLLVIENALSRTLEDVIVVTDDFHAMKDQLERTADRVFSRADAERDTKSADIYAAPEVSTFLTWLADAGLVLLGSRSYSLKNPTQPNINESHGLFRSENPELTKMLALIAEDVTNFGQKRDLLVIDKLPIRSSVHRRSFIDTFFVRIPNSTDEVVVFLGMLTSKALSQEAASVPIVRKKLKQILHKEELLPNSHAYKEIITVLNHMPKAELIQGSVEDILQDISLMRGVHRSSSTRVHLRALGTGRFTSITVVMPKERFSADIVEDLSEHFEERLGATKGSAFATTSIIENLAAAIFILLPDASVHPKVNEIEAIEQEVAERVLTWEDRFSIALQAAFKKAKGTKLFSAYVDRFPEQYKAVTSAAQAVLDVESFASLSKTNETAMAWSPGKDAGECGPFELRIYREGAALTLSSVVPVLENAGLEILNESVTPLGASRTEPAALLYVITVRTKKAIDPELLKEPARFLSGLREVLLGLAESDALNALLLAPGVSLREIALFRTLTHYLFQIKAAPSLAAINNVVVTYPSFVTILLEYFQAKFDPTFSGERDFLLKRLESRYFELLKGVTSIADDRLLHLFLKVIQGTVRTNYYVDRESRRIAIKIAPQQIPNLPRPIPFREIFVSAPEVEGVHFRFGRVARGGLRWSERPDDFRTEVLGLVKTQQVKNTIIVPVGAKGGFIAKTKREKISAEDVTRSYKLFIRSLLEITDNRVGDTVVHPKDVVCHDDFDPYFVVAADKGTAQFSDTANEIAENDFAFWLGDAFASGGSFGYSHKKYGITARGAWDAVLVHFREMGIDVQKQSFTVAGIGDMSGDVFGNGLILSDNAKLIAAFDHRHIFVDPNPDLKSSFAERKRLFDLPRSSWMDYNQALLSKGGGIYSRDEKSIAISPELRAALDITAETLSGQELIRAILKAPVDLLWNGGIGTYVKASSQEHSHAADRTNDDVRVDANELRCRSVGEGGNLGFTQLGRIEYATRGGRINTDAIDNSGGVDLSDHEVNLKILLGSAIRRNTLTRKERDEILLRNVDAVCDSVLIRNRAQSTALSLISKKSSSHLPQIAALLRILEKRGMLDRKGEVLPDNDEIQRRAREHQGLSRPECAVLLAYSKMFLFESLIESLIPDEAYLERFLLSYFPKEIADRFKDEALAHPLRREIIATQLANMIAERMGPVFITRISHELACSDQQVIRAAIAAFEILGAEQIIRQLEHYESASNIGSVHHALLRLQAALYGLTRWLAKEWRSDWTIGSTIERYHAPVQDLFKVIRVVAPVGEQERLQILEKDLGSDGFSTELTNIVASFGYSQALIEISDLALRRSLPLHAVAAFYGALSERLKLTTLLEKAGAYEPMDPWEALARRTTLAQLRGVLQRLADSLIASTGSTELSTIDSFLAANHEGMLRYFEWFEEFSTRPITLGALVVVSDQLQSLCSLSQSANG